jgi:TldD protein
MTSPVLTAPFAAGGPSEVDSEIARKLLAAAMESGGDYADLYFEYRISSDYTLEDEQIKTVGRGVTMGIGVRVLKGDATGYAYSEDLAFDRMIQAARTAGKIAAGGGSPAPIAIRRIDVPDFYPIGESSMALPPAQKLALLKAADAAARGYDPRITKVEAGLVEQIKEVLVVTSDGRLSRDTLPLIRFAVRAVAESAGKRQSGTSGGGGRFGLDYFEQDGRDPVAHGREAARIAIAMLDARDAPAGEMEVALAAGDSGILLHEAVGHGLEADFNRKGTSNYSGQLGRKVASELCTVATC